MKKIFFLVLLFASAFFYLTGLTYSQRMVDYTWDTYHVKFQIPATFNVEKNNDAEFGAGDDDAYLSIYPKKSGTMSFSKMKSALDDWANDSKVYGYDNVKELENLNGYWGVYIDGKKSSNDLPVTLLLLVHPDYPTTMLYVWINYRDAAFDTAVKMLKSFTPMY